MKNFNRINIGLEPVFQHHFKTVRFRVHDDNGRFNTGLPQINPFISHCHRQIIDFLEFQSPGYFHVPASVGKCFHHHHHFCARLQQCLVTVQIPGQRIQVHLQLGLMVFLLKQAGNPLEPELAGTLQKDLFIVKLRRIEMKLKLFRVPIKGGPCLEQGAVLPQLLSDNDQPVDPVKTR